MKADVEKDIKLLKDEVEKDIKQIKSDIGKFQVPPDVKLFGTNGNPLQGQDIKGEVSIRRSFRR